MAHKKHIHALCRSSNRTVWETISFDHRSEGPGVDKLHGQRPTCLPVHHAATETNVFTSTPCHHRFSCRVPIPLFYWQKESSTFPGPPWKILQDLFGAHGCLSTEKKTAFTYSIHSVVHCRKFSMKQNVDVSCSEFRWTYLHMVCIYMQWL